MSLKKEFEQLVKEANDKLQLENKKNSENESHQLQELRKRQEYLMKILSKTNSENRVDSE